MVYVRQIGNEVVTALLVLALVFLSFSQAQASPDFDGSSATYYRAAGVSFCVGGAADSHHASNGPCHACRAIIADLPPPPCDFVPAYARAHRIKFTLENDVRRIAIIVAGYNSRAPPVAV